MPAGNGSTNCRPKTCFCACGKCMSSKLRVLLGAIREGTPQDRHCGVHNADCHKKC